MFFLQNFIFRNFHTSIRILQSRNEQKGLRKYLINNKTHCCIICDKLLPLCLLETAHIKPRSIISNNEKKNIINVELMCLYCHTLYDRGFIGIKKGILVKSDLLEYNLDYQFMKPRYVYNKNNSKYFDYHYDNIFKK